MAQQDLSDKQLNQLSAYDLDLRSFEYKITDQHYDESTGAHYTYFQQYKDGLPVHKAIGQLAINNDREVVSTQRLLSVDLFDLTKSYKSTDQSALTTVMKELGLKADMSEAIFEYQNPIVTLAKLDLIEGAARIDKIWAANQEGRYVRSYLVEVNPSSSADHWMMVVDDTGEILDRYNLTVYCQFDHDHKGHTDHIEQHAKPFGHSTSVNANPAVDGASYRVFAAPLESPDIGPRTLVTNPADPNASPFGWHDLNGQEGPDTDQLIGNNTTTYQDTLGLNQLDNGGPTGGSSLTFDFPVDLSLAPDKNIDADLTNLFYWNNLMHDWSYRFGFTEVAGNFQDNNYGRGGRADDPVLAESLDGSNVNNATFSAPRDGASGRMQMFKWIVGTDLEVLSPPPLVGRYSTGSASFGPLLDEDLIGRVVLLSDIRGDRNDACDMVTNADQLQGNIALVDRGTCDFSFKVYQAQEAGAIGCLVCNNLENAALVSMGPGDSASVVTIPSLFLSREDCDQIKAQLGQTVEVQFGRTKELSSAFDNGVVVHEYGHGISLRLSGGASTSGCLESDEQMGEGWSDFFALVLTQLPDDTPEMPRGIGTFLRAQPRTGLGIRRYPYSTDMTVNPQVHSHIRFTTRPHDVGEIWTAALWDLYWKMIEVYGYDETWQDPTSGNATAVQLVMDGMKLQVCDPTITEGRDAILSADRLNFLGANECLIWEVFARRGLGSNAFGGDNISRYDNVDGFEVPLPCRQEVTVDKSVTPIIDAGNAISVSLDVSNYTDVSYSDVILEDQLPNNLRALNIAAPIPHEIQDGKILFNIGQFDIGDRLRISYELVTLSETPAISRRFDDLQGASPFTLTQEERLPGWQLQSSVATGTISLIVPKDATGGRSFATITEAFDVTADAPLFLFEHGYNADLGIDGGILEISEDGGQTWNQVPTEQFLINGPDDEITDCDRNCPVPDILYRNVRDAFTGVKQNQTSVVDLSTYIGQSVQLRFNYISLLFIDMFGPMAWEITEFEQLEKKELVTEAIIFSGAQELDRTVARTLIRSNQIVDDVPLIPIEESGLTLHPNPVIDRLLIDLRIDGSSEGWITIYRSDGRVVKRVPHEFRQGLNTIEQSVAGLSSGIYSVEIIENNRRHSDTFVVLSD